MTHSNRPGTDQITRALARNRLGVPAVVFFVLSAATPLTVVAGVVTTGYFVTEVTGIPVAFLAIALLLALFSVGYVAMSRHITNAGAFYTYVTHGIGKPAGVAAAWMALLAYNALQVGLYGIIGVVTAPRLADWFDITVYWWVIALVAWAIVALLGVMRVDINGRVLAVLLLSEIAIILLFDAFDLLNPANDTITFDTLAVNNLWQDGKGAILALAVLGFVGFEASVVFSEEARNPRRTVALATYTSIAIIGFVYVLSSWAMSVAVGPDNIVAFAAENQIGTIFVLAGEHLGSTWVQIAEVLFVTSVLAAMISFHNMCGRYAFALGREHVLPGPLGETSPRSGAPKWGSIVQSTIGLVVIIIYALRDTDASAVALEDPIPLVQLFFYGGTTGGFGVLALIAIASISVIAFFARNPSGENAWRRVIAPVLASIGLVGVVYMAVENYDILLGVAPDNQLRWILPGLYAVAAVLGLIWAFILKVTRPDVYDNIGLGANAATGLSTLGAATVAEAARTGGEPAGEETYR